MRVALPRLADIEAAPELAAVAIAVMAALAVRRAIRAAHPVLRRSAIPPDPALDDTELAALGVMLEADALVDALAVYDGLVRGARRSPDDQDLPF